MKRREFIQKAVATTAVLGIERMVIANEVLQQNKSDMPKRRYGKTDTFLSIIGFGGIVVTDTEQSLANRLVAEAVERGVNYFDVAPGYGNAEIKLGPALEPYRKNVFLACKTGQRSRAGAEKEFFRSLDRLKTDYFDLYQLHGITDVKKDVEAAFSDDGIMSFLEEQKKAGRIRHLGFSAHSPEAAEAALDRFTFESILCPLNFACMMKNDFGQRFLELAQKHDIGIMALKAMARQKWPDEKNPNFSKCWYEPESDPKWMELGLRYTLSQPITAAIPPGEAALFKKALDFANNLKPVTKKEIKSLQKYAESLNPIFPIA